MSNGEEINLKMIIDYYFVCLLVIAFLFCFLSSRILCKMFRNRNEKMRGETMFLLTEKKFFLPLSPKSVAVDRKKVDNG